MRIQILLIIIISMLIPRNSCGQNSEALNTKWRIYKNNKDGYILKYPKDLIKVEDGTFAIPDKYLWSNGIVNAKIIVTSSKQTTSVASNDQLPSYKWLDTINVNSNIYVVGQSVDGAAGPDYFKNIYWTMVQGNYFEFALIRGKNDAGVFSSDKSEMDKIATRIEKNDKELIKLTLDILVTVKFMKVKKRANMHTKSLSGL